MDKGEGRMEARMAGWKGGMQVGQREGDLVRILEERAETTEELRKGFQIRTGCRMWMRLPCLLSLRDLRRWHCFQMISD